MVSVIQMERCPVGYDIWDVGTGNLISYCSSEAEALAFVRDAVAASGKRSVSRWALQRIDAEGNVEVIARGSALATRAANTVSA
jgi:hypothetical protein